jgi:NADH-quinone oxidoreductase subunit F
LSVEDVLSDRRQTLDEPVNVREVHRLIADSLLLSDRFDEMVARILRRKLDATGRKVAIAGAGPAGLTAAFYMAMLGHDVTVFDEKPAAGGMLRFAIPEYRLPKDVLESEIELIERAGVKFVFNVRVGVDIALNDLDDDFDAVFISIGTWKEPGIGQPGAELKGVYGALNFLEAIASGEQVHIGRKVAIIGAGNAAIDAARNAIRRGAEATVFYRRERKDMPAIEEETYAAELEGTKFVFRAAPHRIIGDDAGNVKALETVTTRLGEYDTSGRRKPISSGEIQRYDCDTVILATGESVDAGFAGPSGLRVRDNGTIDVNRFTLETSRSHFFAGGDVTTGASNVSGAMALGKQAARSIDRQLMETDRWQKLFPEFEYEQVPPEEPSASRRHAGRMLEPAVRARCLAEVVAALTFEEALDEASRCLRCDLTAANVT